MRQTLLTAILYATCLAAVFADSPSRPVPLVFVSHHGSDVTFSMIPPQYDANYKLTREAFGIASRLNENGKFVEMYRTSGWYSFQVFVSRDGKYLVQMGPWNVGDSPQKDHLAVAFHKNGKLLKSYSTARLVKDPTKVLVTVSHYMWQAPSPLSPSLTAAQQYTLSPSLDYDNTFKVHTIDGWTYEFDATTGEINSETKTKDP